MQTSRYTSMSGHLFQVLFVRNCRGGSGISRGGYSRRKFIKWGRSLYSNFGVIFPKSPSNIKVFNTLSGKLHKMGNHYKMLLGCFPRKLQSYPLQLSTKEFIRSFRELQLKLQLTLIDLETFLPNICNNPWISLLKSQNNENDFCGKKVQEIQKFFCLLSKIYDSQPKFACSLLLVTSQKRKEGIVFLNGNSVYTLQHRTYLDPVRKTN